MRRIHRLLAGAFPTALFTALSTPLLTALGLFGAMGALSTLSVTADVASPLAPPPSGTPRPFSRLRSWPEGTRVPAWVEPLAQRAARVSLRANARQAGPETLWFELLAGKAPWFPYLTAPFAPSRFRLANFGAGGLLVGEIDPTRAATPAAAEAYSWVTLHAPTEPVPLAETAGFADGRGPAERGGFRYFADRITERHPERLAGGSEQITTALSTFWSGGLGCYAAGRGLSKAPGGFDCDPTLEPAGGKEAACLPVASRRAGALEVVRPAPGSRGACYFQRAPVDDRFDFGELEARLACVNETGGLAFPPLEAATALFPTSAPGVYLAYEPLYSPPKVSVLELGTASVRPAARASLLPFERRSGTARLPATAVAQGFEGLYACERGGAKEWYFIDTDLFEGRRAPAPSEDRAFRAVVEEHPSSGPSAARLAITVLEWSDVAGEVPDLDQLPTAGCVLAPAVDLKCALKVVRLTGQLALEIHAGAWDDALDPQVRWSAFGAALGALSEVARRAPRYALAPEVDRLGAFFRRELEGLRATHPAVTGEPWWTASTGTGAVRSTGGDVSRPDEGERAKLLSLLGLPSTLWSDLGEPSGRSAQDRGPAGRGENETSGDGTTESPTASENGDDR